MAGLYCVMCIIACAVTVTPDFVIAHMLVTSNYACNECFSKCSYFHHGWCIVYIAVLCDTMMLSCFHAVWYLAIPEFRAYSYSKNRLNGSVVVADISPSSFNRMYLRHHCRQFVVVVESSSTPRSRRSLTRTSVASPRWRQPSEAIVTVNVASTSAGHHAITSRTCCASEHLSREAHSTL